jgi:signal peptidase I
MLYYYNNIIIKIFTYISIYICIFILNVVKFFMLKAKKSKIYSFMLMIFGGLMSIVTVLMIMCSIEIMVVPTSSMVPILYPNEANLSVKPPFGFKLSSLILRSFFPAVFRTLYFNYDVFKKNLIPFKKIDYGQLISYCKATNTKTNFAKRVLALPGDKVAFRNGYVYINDVRLEKHFLQNWVFYDSAEDKTEKGKLYKEILPNGLENIIFESNKSSLKESPTIIVPEGHVYIIGNNRNNSDDSRLNAGCIPISCITGEPQLVLFGSPHLLGLSMFVNLNTIFSSNILMNFYNLSLKIVKTVYSLNFSRTGLKLK